MFSRADYADRDDAIGEFVLAVLDGEIEPTPSKVAKRRILARVIGRDSHNISLNVRQHADNECMTLSDVIANNDGILFY